MLIDWFTVAAQIVNFLILMGLLKYFLYDRIQNAMDRREENIRSRIADAEQKQAQAEKSRKAHAQKQRELEQQKERILADARQKARDQEEKLTQKAREAVQKQKARWQESLRQQQQAFLRQLRQMAGESVLTISRTAVAQLADADLQQKAVRRFMDKIGQLAHPDQRKLAQSLRRSGQGLTVKTAAPLTDELKAELEDILNQTLGSEKGALQVEYETNPELVLGLEIRTEDQKAAWSLSDYLGGLESDIRRILEGQAASSEKNTPPGEDDPPQPSDTASKQADAESQSAKKERHDPA